MPDESLEARLIDLESRHMHQERLVDELNGIVIEQRRLIDRLAQELKALRGQFEAGTSGIDSGGVDPGGHDDKPPHY